MRTGLAVFAYSSLGRGFFSGRVTRENFKEVADGAYGMVEIEEALATVLHQDDWHELPAISLEDLCQ